MSVRLAFMDVGDTCDTGDGRVESRQARSRKVRLGRGIVSPVDGSAGSGRVGSASRE